MKNIPVSIIVPVYNVEKYLVECLESILAQTFTEFECILVNDNSPDNSPYICDGYAKKDNRIKVIHKKKNQGLPQARKTGLNESIGEYILFTDSDDWIEKDMFEHLYTLACTGNYDMVYCDFYKYDKENNTIYIKAPSISDDYVMNIKHCVLGYNLLGFYAWNKMIKRSIYEKIEFPIAQQTEDRFITTQTLFFSKKIGYINLPLYHHRYNEISLTYDPKRVWIRYKERLINFKNIYNFLKCVHGHDMDAFEPELSKRQEGIIKSNPRTPLKITKLIIKKIFKIIIPFKPVRKKMRNIYNGMKKNINKRSV
jgi:glycosyltransferase involved in cell wall biosynthesis